MENKTIRIAVTSVLIYIVFKRCYNILTELILWLGLELQIRSDFVFIALYSITGILTILLLIGLYNKLLKKKIPKLNVMILLLIASILLTYVAALINKYHGTSMGKHLTGNYEDIYFRQYGITKALDSIFLLIALAYFLWKLKLTKNTEVNEK